MRNRWITPLGAILVVLVAVVLIASAAFAATTYAVPSGYAAGGPANNHTDTWEDRLDLPEGSCVKISPGGKTYTLTSTYGTVIVKAGSDQSALAVNTIFSNVSAGLTVFADSNKTGLFDKGDKDISHIILCDKRTVVTTPPPTTAPPTTAPPTTAPPTTVPETTSTPTIPTTPPTTSVPPTSTTPVVSTPPAPQRSLTSLPATGSDGVIAGISALALLAVGTAAILLSRSGDH